MKLLTLNTHSLMENKYEDKLRAFVNFIIKERPEIIALQEIMQPCVAKHNNNYCCVGSVSLKEGNHAVNIVEALQKEGCEYNLVWLGFKKSYDMFDEGLAILTDKKIKKTMEITLSPFDDYANWKTRKALGVLIGDAWFFSIHMGWWDDPVSPFQYELNKLLQEVQFLKEFWLMGDFNSISEEKNKGYDLIKKRGLYDTYELAAKKDSGATSTLNIDGWGKNSCDEIRIDYIFTNKMVSINSSTVVFNGINERKISDHYGVMVCIDRKEEK